jgi:predicted DNA-binding protein
MNNQPLRRNEEKFVIRLPAGMRSRLADVARTNARSMNSEILHRLEHIEKLETALERATQVIDQLLGDSQPQVSSGAKT